MKRRVAVAIISVLALLAFTAGGEAQTGSSEPLPTAAFLAYGGNFPDALAASAIAGALGAPLLLTDSAALDPAARGVLDALRPDLVVLAGGLGVLSQQVEDEVVAMGLAVRRVAGAGREDTARMLAELAVELGYGRPVVTGRSVAAGVVPALNAELLQGFSPDQLRGHDGVDGEPGPAGPAGPTGPQGAVGPRGPAGAGGVDGHDGADGEDGLDGQDDEDGEDGAAVPCRTGGTVLAIARDGLPLCPLTPVGSVSAGVGHSCAALDDGSAWCWGSNFEGQLGDGTLDARARAVQVSRQSDSAPLTGVTAVTAGLAHSCAALDDGSAWCWGFNEDGQLGDGTTTNRDGAVQVTSLSDAAPLTGVTAVTAGLEHTCAALDDGSAWCWGRNLEGQLGDGTLDARARAVQVSRLSDSAALTGVTAVTAGTFHSCAALGDGSAWCWGINSSGQLGDASTTNRARADQVARSL